MNDLLFLLLLCLPLGAIAGFLAGLFGIGGGIVIVPGLFYIFSLLGYDSSITMHMAIGTSLATIIPTAIVSARAHYKKGAIDMAWFKTLSIPIVVGAIVGSLVASLLDTNVLKSTFSILLIAMAVMLMAGKASDKQKERSSKSFLWSIIDRMYGVASGAVSSLIGIGGATINVPYMAMRNLPINKAIATASLLGLFIATPGALTFIVRGLSHGDKNIPFTLGYIHLLSWICIIPASTFFAPYGARLTHKTDTSRLKIAFACFMILVALKMAI